eukprot:2937609-Rhodomonas_salina.1
MMMMLLILRLSLVTESDVQRPRHRRQADRPPQHGKHDHRMMMVMMMMMMMIIMMIDSELSLGTRASLPQSQGASPSRRASCQVVPPGSI